MSDPDNSSAPRGLLGPQLISDGVRTVSISTGLGSPEGARAAAVGSTYLRTDPPNDGECFYFKTGGGTGNTGWTSAEAISTETLAETLAVGNVTGGTDIALSVGDSITGAGLSIGDDGVVSLDGPLSLGGVSINTGAGTPEGSLAATVGSTYQRTDPPTDGECFYFKTSGGATDTGWTSAEAISTETLAQTLAAGNLSGGLDIQLTNGDSIVGEDGGSVAFATTTGILELSSCQVTGAIATNGGVAADAVVSATDVVLGDGTGAHGLTVFSADDAIGRLAFTDTTATLVGAIDYDHANVAFLFTVEGAVEMALGATVLAPFFDGGLDLGSDAARWANSFVGIGYLGGASAGDGSAFGAELVIGDGTGNRGITIFSANDAGGRLIMADTVGGTEGFLAYEHNNADWVFGVESSSAMKLSATALRSADDGALSLGDAAGAECFSSVQLLERAAQPVGINATHGAFWVRDDEPNTAMYTDDDDVDHALSLMETITLYANFNTMTPATGPAVLATGAGGVARRSVMEYADGSTLGAFWYITMPREYTGGATALTVRVEFVGSTAFGAGDTVEFSVQFERLAAGQLITTIGWGTATVDSFDPGVVTANRTVIRDIVIPNANRDSIGAGDLGMILLERVDGGADDYTGVVKVLSVAIVQDP